jgi:hypothetical protein
MTRDDAFDPVQIIEILDRHRVDFVLVGGYAALLYGARRPTYDIDITPSTAVVNLHVCQTRCVISRRESA